MASVYKRGKNWIASYMGADGLWHNWKHFTGVSVIRWVGKNKRNRTVGNFVGVIAKIAD